MSRVFQESRALPRRWLAQCVLGGLFILALRCSSTEDDRIRAAQLQEGCLINSDCVEPLVCAFRRCHNECTSSRDCPGDQRCIAVDRPFRVCQLDDERDCTRNAECAAALVCGVDGECRDVCASERDCIAGQLCVSGSCADPEELDEDGALPVAEGVEAVVNTPCVYDSDCPLPLLCRAGACMAECREDRDCPMGLGCIDSACRGGADASASCRLNSDCPLGQVCAGGACLCECRETRDCRAGSVCDGCACQPGPVDGGLPVTGASCTDAGGCEAPLVCREGRCSLECTSDTDCAGGSCLVGRCLAPSCSDGAQNGDETDVDCGGSCTACPARADCAVPSDCVSGLCASGRCAEVSCFDQVANGTESDVDCGGDCASRCADGASCFGASDCVSGVCAAGQCRAAACDDGVLNGTETDQDCGGACPPCAAASECTLNTDCASKICTAGVCAAGGCADGVQNQDETGPDCGGTCGPCALGKGCAVSNDCLDGVCEAGVCRAPVSCKELHETHPALGDGRYSVDPDGSGSGTPFFITCDMTQDGGGWTLVTSMLRDTTVAIKVTATDGTDALGGMVHSATTTSTGCDGTGNQVVFIPINDVIAWSEIRYDVEFSGAASCWTIFGRADPTTLTASITTFGLIPLSVPPDTIRNQVAMGGSAGDSFDGITARCDNEPVNFWQQVNGQGVRSATILQRRDLAVTDPAGLGLGVNCTGSAGASWLFQNVYIR